jgi:predicted DNA-binding protein
MTSLSFLLPRETARKLSRLGEIMLDGSKTPFHCSNMPGQRHPDKTTLSVYLPRTLMQRLRRLATERGETVTTVIEAMVTAQTREVVLTPEDYEQIAQETRQAQSGRKPVPKSGSKGG